MSPQMSYIPRRLRAREVLDIRNGQGLVVRCLAGALWITQDGDTDDVVVKAGQCFVLDRRGLALVSAPVGAATVVVERAARGAPCAAQRYTAPADSVAPREAMPRAEQRLIGGLKLVDGMRVTVRPACAWDAGRIQDYIRGLSLPSRYGRFLAPINELSPAELARVGGSDDRHGTLVAETKIDGARIMIGEARYALGSDGKTGEIALSVGDAWHHRGLGTLLMDFLECRARSLGAATLVGDVLHSNKAMRKLACKSGFDTGVPADATLVRIVKDISAARIGVPCRQLMRAGLPIAA